MTYDPHNFVDGERITEERINSLRAFELTNAHLAASANISWTKVDKTGSALTDFFAGPTIPLQFIPSGIVDPIVNADIASGANIDWSKISKTGSSLGDLGTRTISQITDFPSQSSQGGKVLSTNGSILSWVAQNASDLKIGTSTGSEGANNAGGGYLDIGPSVTFTAKGTSVFAFLLIDYVRPQTQTSYETGEVNFAIRINNIDNYVGTTSCIFLRSETGIMAQGIIISGLTAGTTYTAQTRAYARTDRYPTYGDNFFTIGSNGRKTIGILQI